MRDEEPLSRRSGVANRAGSNVYPTFGVEAGVIDASPVEVEEVVELEAFGVGAVQREQRCRAPAPRRSSCPVSDTVTGGSSLPGGGRASWFHW